MTRVLIVCDSLDNGGAERQMTLLATNLPDDFAVRVFSLGNGAYAEVLRGAGVDLQVAPRRWRYDVSPALRMWREIRAWRPDVVHAWGWMAAAAAMAACKPLRIPLVDGTVRTGRPTGRWAGLNRFLTLRADASIANSRAGAVAHGLTGPRAFVVHNGFETDRVPDVHRPPRDAGAPAEVVMAARMVPAKDFDTLIAAAEILQGRGCRFRFTLVGDGPERDRLAARSLTLAEAGCLRFLECGLDVMPVLAAADIGVLLTDDRHAVEGLSNSIMEYMACGLPVVCTDTGGNPEIVEDGGTGVLVPPRDPTAAADALARLIDDPDTARRFGEAGRERVATEFSTRAMVDGTVRVYRSVIREG
jgi:glycosyltransferase involved in cell wall biosynthesis